MRILLISHYYHPEYGAPQRRWSGLVQRFIGAGHSVVVLAPPPHYPYGRVPARWRHRFRPFSKERGAHGETVLRTAYLPHRGDILTRSLDHAIAAAHSVLRARRWLAGVGRRPDVIIATAPAVESIVAGRVLAAQWRVPIVVEMRDAWPDLVANIGPEMVQGRGWAGQLIARLKRSVHRRITGWQSSADHVVTTTRRFAEVLQKRGVRHVEVIRNGTDLRRIPLHAPQEDRAGRELRCLYLGNMGRAQGLEVVVASAARLAREGVNIRVRLVGHGARASNLRRLAQELNAPVDIHERIPHSEVYQHYAWADTVIVSLRNWEPFEWTIPSKLYEMLATGRHITGIVAGESAEVLREAEAGDVVPPGDAQALTSLWRCLAATPGATTGSTNGREWVAAHAGDDLLARQYLSILERVISRRREDQESRVHESALF